MLGSDKKVEKLGQFELEFFIFWCNIKRTSNITCKNILLNLKRALLDRLIPKIDSESDYILADHEGRS